MRITNSDPILEGTEVSPAKSPMTDPTVPAVTTAIERRANTLLRQLRESKNLTTKEVSKLLKIHVSTYRNAENGWYCGPKAANAIAKFFARPLEELLPQYGRRGWKEDRSGRPKFWTDSNETFAEYCFRKGLVGRAYAVVKHWLNKNDKEMAKWVINHVHGMPIQTRRLGGERGGAPIKFKGAILNLPAKVPVRADPQIKDAEILSESKRVVSGNAKTGEEAA